MEACLTGLAAAGAIAASLWVAPGWSGAAGAALAALMLAIAAIDLRWQIIPDELNAAAFVAGLAAAAAAGPVAEAAASALVRAAATFAAFFAFRLLYRKARRIEGMGLGDVKLAAVAGAWLDWPLLPLAVELAAFAALAAALLHRLGGGRLDRAARLPFGAFFGPAIWICWFAGAWCASPGAL